MFIWHDISIVDNRRHLRSPGLVWHSCLWLLLGSFCLALLTDESLAVTIPTIIPEIVVRACLEWGVEFSENGRTELITALEIALIAKGRSTKNITEMIKGEQNIEEESIIARVFVELHP